MKREIKFVFVIENEGEKHFSAPYTVEDLLETTEEDILMAMEPDCESSGCNNESQNFCDCGGVFENAKIVGKQQFTGLTDKTGREMYEGQTCEIRYNSLSVPTVTGVIEWFELHTCFSLRTRNGGPYLLSIGGSIVDGIYITDTNIVKS
jgi:hypothetical protein